MNFICHGINGKLTLSYCDSGGGGSPGKSRVYTDCIHCPLVDKITGGSRKRNFIQIFQQNRLYRKKNHLTRNKFNNYIKLPRCKINEILCARNISLLIDLMNFYPESDNEKWTKMILDAK